MSIKKGLNLFSHYISARRWREILNIIFWIYPLWWNKKLQHIILNKIQPALGLEMLPPFLEVEHTTFCDKRCIICEHTYWKEKPKHMSFEQFKKVYGQFGKLKWIGLTGIGSSYLNPDFHKIVAYAKSKGTVVELMDHFNHMNEKLLRELIDIGPDFFFISIYGTNQETYGKVCVNGDWNKVLENLKLFAKIKREKKAHFPLLSFHYIVSRDTKPEIYRFLDIVSGLDTEIAEVLITPLMHSFKEAEHLVEHISDKDIEKIKEYAAERNISVTINQNVPKNGNKRPINRCIEYIMPFIFVTGHMIPCCGANEANQREIQKTTAMGNIFEKPLKEIWYGPRYTQLRNLIRSGELPFVCRECPAYDIKGLKPIAIQD